ncbi:MAG: hypothetical protein ACRD1C_04660 [Terriglobales bacterium]
MQENGTATALLRAWPERLVHLAVLLGTAPEPTRGKIVALYNRLPALAEGELLPTLRLLSIGLLRNVATALASSLGCQMDVLLRFADPASTARELETKDALLRRLDRYWGGIPLLTIEARDEVWLCWPGPLPGRLIALRGRVEVDGTVLASHDYLPLKPGGGLMMARGALVMLRRPLLGTILEVIHSADLSVAEVIAAACEAVITVRTPAGPLTYYMAKSAVMINRRYIRLSTHEAIALEVLLRRPGVLTERGELDQALGFTTKRALDRVMLHLRNKFGDGLITTLYGSGYILETGL